MERVEDLEARGIRLTTTVVHATELRCKLIDVFELSEREAAAETERIVSFFDLILPNAFEYLRPDAEARLSAGGKSDWPALAAAMAFEGAIWSDDRDFFGVGVPVWSSGNVLFAEPSE